MKPSFRNRTYSIGLLSLLIGFGLPASAQNSNPKKQIRITIMEDGKTRTDTSFEVNRDIPQDELNALIDHFQANPDSDTFHFPSEPQHNQAFAFPFGNVHGYHFPKDIDSMLENIHRQFGFSMNFDNDSVFEKQFGFQNGDSIISPQWQGKPGKTWEYRWSWKGDPRQFPKGQSQKLKEGNPDNDTEIGPTGDPMILEFYNEEPEPQEKSSNNRTIEL